MAVEIRKGGEYDTIRYCTVIDTPIRCLRDLWGFGKMVDGEIGSGVLDLSAEIDREVGREGVPAGNEDRRDRRDGGCSLERHIETDCFRLSFAYGVASTCCCIGETGGCCSCLSEWIFLVSLKGVCFCGSWFVRDCDCACLSCCGLRLLGHTACAAWIALGICPAYACPCECGVRFCFVEESELGLFDLLPWFCWKNTSSSVVGELGDVVAGKKSLGMEG